MSWNDFKGNANRIDDIDLPKIGAQIGVGEDEIHAVIDVEAAGSGFDSQGRPRILFERHHFYRRLKGAKLKRAIKEGLAVRRWSRATYNKDQYQLLQRAMKIDETAALQSASWGMGQIMGWNHGPAGFENVQNMVRAFMEDEEFHLQAMIDFIKSNNLDDNLRNHDWEGFAEGYNGAGYKQNKYDEKLAASFAKWSRIKDTPYPPDKPEPKPIIKSPKAVEKALREDGSRTIKNADEIKSTWTERLWTLLSTGGLGSLAFVKDMDPWLIAFAIVFAAAGFLYLQYRKDKSAEKIIHVRVEDTLSGKHIGRSDAVERA